MLAPGADTRIARYAAASLRCAIIDMLRGDDAGCALLIRQRDTVARRYCCRRHSAYDAASAADAYYGLLPPPPEVAAVAAHHGHTRYNKAANVLQYARRQHIDTYAAGSARRCCWRD